MSYTPVDRRAHFEKVKKAWRNGDEFPDIYVEALILELDLIHSRVEEKVKRCCNSTDAHWCESYGCSTLIDLIGGVDLA